ncbi:MAG TPA: phage tail tube protein [Burkholderiaceae bacterium]|nr:phage tail tube protein [Burkholderiaceae bacterium]
MSNTKVRPLFSAVQDNPLNLPHSYTDTPAGMQPTPFQQQQAVMTAAGTIMSICATAPATYDEAGYTASGMVFTPIGEITDMGSHGKTSAEITHKPIATRWVQVFKGSHDVGTMTVQLAINTADPGQIIAQQVSDTDENCSIKIEYPNGDADYMQAMIFGFPRTISGVDTIVNASINVRGTGAGGVGVVYVVNS